MGSNNFGLNQVLFCDKTSYEIINKLEPDRVMIAIQSGNLNEVQRIIFHLGFNFCKSWLGGYALLKIAIQCQQSDIALWLLMKNCEINRLDTNDTSDTPLHLAISNYQTDIIRKLLEKHASISVRNTSGETPLHISIMKKNSSLSEYFILLMKQEIVNLSDDYLTTPLHLAVEYECLKTVLLLLKHEASANSYTIKPEFKGFTPLHIAVLKNDEHVVRALLDNGADVNATVGISQIKGLKNDELICDLNYKDYTPLHLAVQQNNIAMTKLLLMSGANVNAVIDATGIAPIHLAVINKNEEIVKELSLHANFRVMTKNRETIVHLAAQCDWNYLVEVLLKKGSNINDQTIEGTTVLHIALERRNINLVQILLEYNPKINIKDNKLQSPLHLATTTELFIARALLHLQADIDAVNSYNETPLMIAVKNNDVDMVSLFLRNHPSIYNKINRSALYLALENDCSFHQIAKLLIKYGFTLKSEDLNNTNLLFDLITRSCCDIFKIILKQMIYNLDFKSPYNTLLLNKALSKRKFSIAKLLLENKCEVNDIDKDNQTPIDYAIKCNNFAMLDLLITHGAKTPNLAQTFLTAAKNNDTTSFRIFLKHGLNVNTSDEYGTTALHFATWNKNEAFTNFLLSKNAVINTTKSLKDYSDTETDLYTLELKRQLFMTPLHIAINKMAKNIYSILLEHHADVNSKDGFGRTPLHIACAVKLLDQKSAIQTLFRYGADINVFDDFKKLPIYYIHNQTCVCSVGFQHQYDLYNECECDFYEDHFDSIAAFIKHIVILLSLDEKVHEDNLKFIIQHVDLRDIKDNCFAEITRMKETRISESNFVTYYDLLVKKSNTLAAYARNADVLEAFESSNYIDEFPLYCENLQEQIIEAQQRECLLKSAISKFNEILTFSLPKIVAYNIFDYLHLNDFNNISLAAEIVVKPSLTPERSTLNSSKRLKLC